MERIEMYIFLDRMEFYAYHGVGLQETVVGNTFFIDLKIKVDFSNASETDNVEDTVSYADVQTAVKQEMEIPSKLLEHVCQRIVNRLFHEFETIEVIEIKLVKRNPPMNGQTESAGVIMSCTR